MGAGEEGGGWKGGGGSDPDIDLTTLHRCPKTKHDRISATWKRFCKAPFAVVRRSPSIASLSVKSPLELEFTESKLVIFFVLSSV